MFTILICPVYITPNAIRPHTSFGVIWCHIIYKYTGLLNNFGRYFIFLGFLLMVSIQLEKSLSITVTEDLLLLYHGIYKWDPALK